MFKSKVFQYCAIASAIVVTSGAIWASSTNLKPQTKALVEAQAQADINPANAPDKNLSISPEIEPDILAQLPVRPDREKSPDLASGRVLKQLNLSPEQLQKLKAVRDRNNASISDLMQRSRQASKELRDLLASNEADAIIRAKHEEVLNLHQDLRRQHFERTLDMREILTPQQRSQLNEIMKNNRPRMRDRLKERFGNRPRT